MINGNTAIENARILLSASKKRNFVVAQVSPAVRVAIGETFGLRRGEDGVGKVVAALSALGADVVVDTAVVTDALTLMKVQALRAAKDSGDGKTVYSSECSKWVAYAKENHPQIAEDLLPSATTVSAKLLKKYYGAANPDKKIRVIALEMGAAKKADAGVDVALTLEELAELLAATGLNLRLMKKKAMETPFGVASGAAYAAYASGGEAEAIARALCSDKTPATIRKFEYCGFYDKKDFREVELALDGKIWHFAVADTLDAVETAIANGTAYDYVEATACRGGFVGMGCDLSEEEGERTRRLRKLGLKYLDNARASRSADGCAAAERLVKEWKALVRGGEADAFDTIDEIVEDIDEEEIVEETVVEIVGETPVEEAIEETVEEAIEKAIEETVEEAVEEAVEETPSREALEEIVGMVMENVVDMEEVVEDAIEDVAEDVADDIVEEIREKVGEIVSEEELEDKVEDVVEDAIEEIVEEKMDEIVEAVAKEVAEEMLESDDSLEELIEDAIEDTIEEIVEKAQDEIVEDTIEEIVKDAGKEEIAEETVEEADEAPAEESAEETVEETEEAPAEESAEETVEETEEAPAEESAEETVEEAEEAPAEEIVEETVEVSEEEVQEAIAHVEELLGVDEKDLTPAQKIARATYYRRLSTKERRKLKRLKRNSKK